MQKVLVAGSTGYLGKYVTQEFKQRGYWIRALARSPGKLECEGPFLEPATKNIIDDVFTAQATKPDTLKGLCDGIDIVFSSLGITRQQDNLTFHDVDYQANRNILDLALQAGVKKFIFVSVFNAELLKHIPIVRTREEFVKDLKGSGLEYTIIRPTGYFSDMSEFFRMALAGRIYLIGDGSKRLNPIHGADLAKVCVDAVVSQEREVPVGGPQTFTHNEIARLAFTVADRKPKITRIPSWMVNATVKAIHPFSERYYALASFFSAGMQMDFAAPETGTHTLEEYYQQILSCVNVER